jgi:hypothetical protein
MLWPVILKQSIMKKLIPGIAMLLFVNMIFAQPTKIKKAPAFGALVIPLTADHWDAQPGKVEFLNYKGKPAVKLNEQSDYILYKDLDFTNGTIEFDVEVNRAMPFPTIYFRWQTVAEAEHVYLRTGVANTPNALDALQYASIIHGVNIWDLQHEYQCAAHIKIGDWNHIKLVVSGKQLRVYINNAIEPNLEVPCLEGNTASGKIGLGTGFPGEAIFASLVVRPNETAELSGLAGADLTRHDTRYIRNWRVSSPMPLANGQELNADMLPKSDSGFTIIASERRGLLNLSRVLGNSESRRFVWLRTKISSSEVQRVLLRLGFSDEVWVFLNKQPLYVDKNIYYLNMRKSPNGRISLDNCSFLMPLIKGDNDLVIGVANDFYGWGIMARLEELDGVVLE